VIFMAWENWRGDELMRLLNDGAVKAVSKTGEVILAAGKTEVAHDEGTLESTGIVVMAANNIPACVVTFGGGPGTGFPIVPYAIKWHEKQANFQRGRKWKYLRDPVNRLAESTLQAALLHEMGLFL
jgi:hypothetical protein